MKSARKYSKAETGQHKKMFLYEDAIGVFSAVSMLTLVLLAALVEMPDYQRVVLVVAGFVGLLIGVSLCLKIEVETGEYQCAKCGHGQKPSYWQVFWAMHFGRTRYLACSKCHKKSWQKKVI